MAFDFKKEYKEFYMPKNKPQIVTIPKANYIAVRGKGNPNEEGGEYKTAMFDFIDYTEEMLETDIENELVKNVTSLLMELGTGFAFMGQQYHLEVGGKDFYIDLLFYNTKLRCYVAIDLKTGEFKPEQAGKMNFYLSALDDLVKAPEDNPSVGLILCRDENRTIAEYALRDMSKPIGVSEYHLCTDLPLDLKDALPAVEDIRSRIDMKK